MKKAFWLTEKWQTRASLAVQGALNEVHARLNSQGKGNREWTREVLQSLVPVARSLCGETPARPVCALAYQPDAQCSGEWLYDFVCWLEIDGKGFAGLPIVAESEWGKWPDIWDDLDKLTQSRAGLRVLIFQYPTETPDWHHQISQRVSQFEPRSPSDAWLFACWKPSGFEYETTLAG